MKFLPFKLDTSFLKELILQRANCSVPEFAQLIGYSRSIIYPILYDGRQPSLSFLLAVYKAINLSAADHFRLFHSMKKEHAMALGKMVEDYCKKHNLI